MALSFDCQETKSNTETLGSNYTLSELRLICTQIKKNICSIKTTTQLTISETPLIEGIDIPQSAADNPVSFRHVVFTVQNRLLYLVQLKRLKFQSSKSFCALKRIWASKYSKRWLFHMFTILRVMFGETSKLYFVQHVVAFSVANSKSSWIFRSWSAIYDEIPMSSYCRELIWRKP